MDIYKVTPGLQKEVDFYSWMFFLSHSQGVKVIKENARLERLCPLRGSPHQHEGSMISSSQEHCHCPRRDAPLRQRERQPTQRTIRVFLTHHGSMLSPVRNTVVLQWHSLLVGWQQVQTACNSSATTIPKTLLLGTGLTWSDSSEWVWVSSI